MNIKQSQILNAVLACVPQDGWTAQAFARGIKRSGVTPAQAAKLFPDGIAGIVAAFHLSINEAMQARIKARRNFSTLRVRDKITFAVRARLEATEPHREAMRRLLVWAVLPCNLRASMQQLWNAADEIWVSAGDTSTDYNYYTKRILLIGVMKTTLAFWLNDASPDCVETWKFLDRRIEDVMRVGKGISMVKTLGVADIMSLVRRFAA